MKVQYEYFSNVVCTLIEKLFAANPCQTGTLLFSFISIIVYYKYTFQNIIFLLFVKIWKPFWKEILEGLFFKLLYLGQESEHSSSSEDSAGYHEESSIDGSWIQTEKDKYLFENRQGLKKFGKLSESQARKIQLMNSLVRILRILDNGKLWIISSLVYIDKLNFIGDIIPVEDLHW